MNTDLTIYLIVPTIRDLAFFSEWMFAFARCHLIVVEDRERKEVTIPHDYFASITHLCWQDIRSDFGKDEWIFSRHNAGIRAYGFWKAWKAGADIIITLDDDCFPVGDPSTFVSGHVNNLLLKAPRKWFATYPDPKWMYTRGFPYEIRDQFPVMVSHGLWSGALDLDGRTETKLSHLLSESSYPSICQFVPFGYYYPMCSMNLAFRREVVPLMFFPMMGNDLWGNGWGYDRFDDIWAGIFSKRILDHLRWSVVNGSPQVEHRKKSLPTQNSKKEESGRVQNEMIWELVDKVKLTEDNVLPVDLYNELISSIVLPDTSYFNALRKAIKIWLSYF